VTGTGTASLREGLSLEPIIESLPCARNVSCRVQSAMEMAIPDWTRLHGRRLDLPEAAGVRCGELSSPGGD
jgi:hypothetical protein